MAVVKLKVADSHHLGKRGDKTITPTSCLQIIALANIRLYAKTLYYTNGLFSFTVNW